MAQAALERLDQAFITPLDREDILHLISDLYTVVETITGFAKRVTLYGFERIDPDLKVQVEILSKMASCLEEVMRRLRKDNRLKTLNGQLKGTSSTGTAGRRSPWRIFGPTLPRKPRSAGSDEEERAARSDGKRDCELRER